MTALSIFKSLTVILASALFLSACGEMTDGFSATKEPLKQSKILAAKRAEKEAALKAAAEKAQAERAPEVKPSVTPDIKVTTEVGTNVSGSKEVVAKTEVVSPVSPVTPGKNEIMIPANLPLSRREIITKAVHEGVYGANAASANNESPVSPVSAPVDGGSPISPVTDAVTGQPVSPIASSPISRTDLVYDLVTNFKELEMRVFTTRQLAKLQATGRAELGSAQIVVELKDKVNGLVRPVDQFSLAEFTVSPVSGPAKGYASIDRADNRIQISTADIVAAARRTAIGRDNLVLDERAFQTMVPMDRFELLVSVKAKLVSYAGKRVKGQDAVLANFSVDLIRVLNGTFDVVNVAKPGKTADNEDMLVGVEAYAALNAK